MKIHGPQVLDPRKPFGPYDLEQIYDRCINCEARKKIWAVVDHHVDRLDVEAQQCV
jgi:hypothetical protein